MARVSKAPDVRRDELFEVAVRLFQERGFTNVTIQDITDAARVAKGTFYYYFAGKDALMFALIDRFGDGLFDYLEANCQPTGTGLDQLSELMSRSAAYKWDHLDAALSYLPALYRPENRQLQDALNSEWLARCELLLVPILQTGLADGSFDIDDPETTAHLLLSLWIDFGRRLWERALGSDSATHFGETIIRGSEAIWTAQERILGVAPGTFQVDVATSHLEDLYQYFTAEIRASANTQTRPHPPQKSRNDQETPHHRRHRPRVDRRGSLVRH